MVVYHKYEDFPMKKYRLSSLLVTFVLALTLLAPFSALAADAPHLPPCRFDGRQLR